MIITSIVGSLLIASTGIIAVPLVIKLEQLYQQLNNSTKVVIMIVLFSAIIYGMHYANMMDQRKMLLIDSGRPLSREAFLFICGCLLSFTFIPAYLWYDLRKLNG